MTLSDFVELLQDQDYYWYDTDYGECWYSRNDTKPMYLVSEDSATRLENEYYIKKEYTFDHSS